ncbi:MAG: hypothetical protein DRN15_01445 [Thermoprotei archaeon]|nr:MAG: hypothetical protein DRN15_01445 [Thermoprotei archaeon]RLF25859.1 MAG: hypothetical protein DRM97_00340 [Thermoprotei archaeon]
MRPPHLISPEIVEAMKKYRKLGHLTGIFLLSSDGLTLVADYENELDESLFAAMGASLASMASTIADEAKLSEVRRVFIEAKNGGLIVLPVKDEFLLVATFPPTTRIGVALYCLRRLKDIITESLSKL